MADFFLHNLLGRTIVAYIIVYGIPLMIPILFIKMVGLKGLRNMFAYDGKNTVIHRLDPRIKVLYPVTMGALSVFLNWNWVYALFAVTLIPWILVRPSGARLKILINMTLVPALGEIWQAGLFFTGRANELVYAFPWTISWVGTAGLSTLGLQYGAEQAGRFLVTVSASLLLIFTTDQSEIVWACMKMKMPVKMGFAISVGLRFLPEMFERLSILMQSMEVRGYSFTKPQHWWDFNGLVVYVKRLATALPLITVPLIVGSLRGTDVMAMVADSRAFGAYKTRSAFEVHRTTSEDKIAWAAYASIIAAVFFITILHIGNRTTFG